MDTHTQTHTQPEDPGLLRVGLLLETIQKLSGSQRNISLRMKYSNMQNTERTDSNKLNNYADDIKQIIMTSSLNLNIHKIIFKKQLHETFE